MSYEIRWTERALNEIKESFDFYEQRATDLGSRFQEAILNEIKQIKINPSRGLLRRAPYRESIVDTFPFLVVYRLDRRGKCVYIQSIFHTSRDPKGKYLR